MKKSYVVTVLMHVRVDDHRDECCWEDVYFVRGKSKSACKKVVKRLARKSEVDYLNYEGNRVFWEYMSIANIQRIRNADALRGVAINSYMRPARKYEPRATARFSSDPQEPRG